MRRNTRVIESAKRVAAPTGFVDTDHSAQPGRSGPPDQWAANRPPRLEGRCRSAGANPSSHAFSLALDHRDGADQTSNAKSQIGEWGERHDGRARQSESTSALGRSSIAGLVPTNLA